MKEQSTFKVTVLGSGTSQGVPMIGCKCAVCRSENPKDKRLRSSIMLTIDKKNYVIDTGPDFRYQMLREKVETLEAVIFTHQHKDHIAGLDDVRAFNFLEEKDMKVYCDERVNEALHNEFSYIFSTFQYPGIPKLDIKIIDKDSTIQIGEESMISIEALHYKLPVLGYRFRDFAYITDANFIAEAEKDKLKNLDILILNALRKEEHLSHFNLEQALALIEELQPKKAYLTHISHLMGLHDEINQEIPDHVNLAYDGLSFEL